MKNTAAVFLTSLAVSAISLTVPLPAASTVLNLFIGEDIAVQDTTNHHIQNYQQAPLENHGAKGNSAYIQTDNQHCKDTDQTTFSFGKCHDQGKGETNFIQRILSNASATLRQGMQQGVLHLRTNLSNRVQPLIALHTYADEAEVRGSYYQAVINSGEGYLKVTRGLK